MNDAVEVAQALFRGGLPVIEVTLRTPQALDAITAMVEAVPDAVIGAGTVLTPAQMQAAKQAGARFAVSPAPRRHCTRPRAMPTCRTCPVRPRPRT